MPKKPIHGVRKARAANLSPLKVLGILAASAGQGLTLAEMRHRHGVGLRELLALERVLGDAAEIGAPGPALSLDIFRAESGAARVRTLSKNARVLKALAGLPLPQAALALGALQRLTAPGELALPLRRLAERLRRRVPAAEQEAAPLSEGAALSRVERAALAEAEEALRQGRELNFEYRGVSRHSDARRTRPLSITQAGGWRMAAWDLDRRAVRVFLLDKMLKPRLEGPCPAPAEALAALHKLGPMEGYHAAGGESRVVVRVTADLARDLKSRLTFVGEEKAGPGWVRLTLQSASPPWVTHTFLPLIPQVKVEGPEAFERHWTAALKGLL